MRPLTCGVALFAFFSVPALAQVRVAPGDYITEGGAGKLSIQPGDKGALKFDIEVFAPSRHVCGLAGEIRNGRARVETPDPRKPCLVTFTPKGEGIDVTVNDARVCSEFCGARAHFVDLYLRAPPSCVAHAVKKARDEFRRAYDRKDYAKAQALLDPVLRDCRRALEPVTEGWIRNDLALTQYRRGNAAECRRTLAPLATDAAKTDDAIQEDRLPNDAAPYIAVVKAARTNLKLCAASK